MLVGKKIWKWIVNQFFLGWKFVNYPQRPICWCEISWKQLAPKLLKDYKLYARVVNCGPQKQSLWVRTENLWTRKI